MLRFLFLAVCVCFFTKQTYSQTYNIATNNGQSINTCSGNFYDSGGSGGSYGNNENYTITFCSSSGLPLKFDFSSSGSFDIDCSGDSLFFYNGTTATGTPIAVLTSADDNTQTTYSSQLQINTLSTCVTIKFKSNASCVDAGWNAAISCGSPPTCAGNPPASDIFGQATPICNLNSYCGTTASYYAEDTPYNLIGGGTCPVPDDAIFGGTIENNSWLSFQAVTTSASFNFTTGSCGGGGLQIGIFGFNGSAFTLQSPCATTDGSQTGSFSVNATSLVAGNTYYIMIDGNGGAICDYTITANTGVATITAGPDQNICTTTSTMAASTPASGSGVWTVVSGTGTFANPNSPTSTVSGLSTGANVFTWTYASGACASVSDNVTINVTAGSVPTISYAGPFCTTVATAQSVTLVGTSGGVYSSTAGLTINSSTGAITPSTSTAGTYTVTYTVAGACSPGTTSVVINSNTTPTFSITTSICTGAVAPVLPTTSNNNINGTWSPTTISNTVGATYTFTPNVGQCAAATSVTTTVSAGTTPTYTKTSTNVTCSGPNTGTITFSNILTGSTFNWVSGPIVSPIPTANIPSGVTNESALINLPAGTYCANITGPPPGTTTQTLFTETFESGIGNWTLNNSSGTNIWVNNNSYAGGTCAGIGSVAALVNQPAAITGSPQSYYLHIAATSTAPVTCGAGSVNFPPLNANFNGSQASTQVATLNTVINTTGLSNIVISFYWLGDGDNNDYAVLESSINGGTTWVQAGAVLNNQTAWVQTTRTSATWANLSNLRFRFRWINNSSSSQDPPIAIDQIVVTGDLTTSCSSTVQECFTISPPSGTTPVTNFSYTTPVCATATNPSPTGASGFTSGGTYSSTSGLSINSSTGVINLTSSTPGTYTVTYAITASGCTNAGSSTATFTINAATTPVTSFTYVTPICSNGTNPLPTTSVGFVTGGTFSSTAGLSINAGTGLIDLTQSTAGTYIITYSVVASGCVSAGSSTFSITIQTSPTPNTNFSYASPLCINATNPSPTLAAGFSTGGTFSSTANLSINGSTGLIDLSQSTAGTYTVTYNISASTCASAGAGTASIIINPLTTPVTAFSYSSPVCLSGVNPTPTQSIGFVTGGTYSSTAGLSINSSTGVIDLALSSAGTYVVTYSVVSAGCVAAGSSNANITITNAIVPVTSFSYASPFCLNSANALPNLGVGFTTGGTYSSTAGLVINSNTGEIDLTNSSIGTYVISYNVIASGCSAAASNSATVTILGPPATTSSITGNSPICPNALAQVFSVTNNVGSTYLWTVPAGAVIVSGQGTNAITVNWGTVQGDVIVTESNNCGASPAVNFNVNLTNIVATSAIVGTASVCPNTNALNYNVTNVNIGSTYNWTITGGTIVSGNGTSNVVVNWAGVGNATLTVTETTTCGVSIPVSMTVVISTPPLAPIIQSGSDSICQNSSNIVYFVNNNPTSNYAWVVPIGATIISGQGTNSITVNWGTTGGTVTLTEISICGNGALATYQVYVLAPPVAPVILGNDTVCSGALLVNYSTTNTLGNTYTWSINNGSIINGQGTNSVDVNWNTGPNGAISVSESNKCGTSAPTTFLIKIISIAITPSNDVTICKGDSATLHVAGNAISYQWTPSTGLNNSASTDPVASPQITTEYIVSSLGQCSKSDTVIVNVVEMIKPSFVVTSATYLINEPFNFTNTTNNHTYSYNWQFSDGNAMDTYDAYHNYSDTGVYAVVLTAMNEFNCVDTAIQLITVLEPPVLFIPNAFTPNQDNINDVFKPVFRNYKKIDAYIFDRWGNKIYEWHTLNGGWDGKVGGIDAQLDVYVYLIKLYTYENQEIPTIRKEDGFSLIR